MPEDTADPLLTRQTPLLRLRDQADHESWAEFADIYTPLLYAYCQKRELHHADIADIAQIVGVTGQSRVRRWSDGVVSGGTRAVGGVPWCDPRQATGPHHRSRLCNVLPLDSFAMYPAANRLILLSLACLLLSGCIGSRESEGRRIMAPAIFDGIAKRDEGVDIAAGLKEALRVGTETVVGRLGKTDGFNRDRAIRISLPKRLDTVRGWLDRFGMGGSFDELEIRLNRAAESATPKAKKIFWQAIREMTLSDAKAIFRGPNDAATQYFRRKMSPRLEAAMAPVITRSLAQVGAIQRYDQIISRYDKIPGAPKVAPDLKAELASHTVNGALGGIFHYLAREEAAIRENPAKRTTELLRAVFGSR